MSRAITLVHGAGLGSGGHERVHRARPSWAPTAPITGCIMQEVWGPRGSMCHAQGQSTPLTTRQESGTYPNHRLVSFRGSFLKPFKGFLTILERKKNQRQSLKAGICQPSMHMKFTIWKLWLFFTPGESGHEINQRPNNVTYPSHLLNQELASHGAVFQVYMYYKHLVLLMMN